ncbi:MAG: hypothetical protein ACXQTB_02340 [Candidatus Nezhaarchaeales archaeon]
MSDHPMILQRNLYLQLRFLLRFGYDRAKAMSTITLNSAKYSVCQIFLVR